MQKNVASEKSQPLNSNGGNVMQLCMGGNCGTFESAGNTTEIQLCGVELFGGIAGDSEAIFYLNCKNC